MALHVVRALFAFGMLLLPAWCIQSLTRSRATGYTQAHENDVVPDITDSPYICDFVNALASWKGPAQSQVTVYMLGDSLLFGQIHGPCMSPMATKHRPAIDSWKEEALIAKPRLASFAEHEDFFDADLAERGEEGVFYSCELPLPGQSTLTLLYYSEPRPPQSPDALNKMRAHIGRDPDVLYFDAGLHYLQLLPARPHFAVDYWMSPFYEDSLSEFLSQPFVQKTPKVVFLQSHSICEKAYYGDYGAIVARIARDPEGTAQACVDHVQEHFGHTDLSGHTQVTQNISIKECESAFLVNKGIKALNGRAVSAIAAWNAKNRRQVDVLDAFHLTSGHCELTQKGDGRHYNALVYKEMKILLSLVGKRGDKPDFEFRNETNAAAKNAAATGQMTERAALHWHCE